MYFRLLIIVFITLHTFSATAQGAVGFLFTSKHPLVYEDPVNLWPYSFINEKGEPDGYNIDLLKILMKQLDIPYVIRLKPHQAVLKDLKEGKSDLTLGPTAMFYNIHGLYGRQTIMLLTQSVATPKSQSVSIKTFRDLSKNGQRVMVSDSSLCHHLMCDYGWGANAVPRSDMSEAIREVSQKGEGQVVWNTLSLEWLIRHYQLDNLMVTPVNMPHGAYRYMSNNRELLDLIDKTYVQLYVAGRLSSLEQKWFYPDRARQKTSVWVWCLAGLSLILLVAAMVYLVYSIRQYRRISGTSRRLNGLLEQVTEDVKVRAWTYHIKKGVFAWLNAKGQLVNTQSREEFAKRYSKEDFEQLMELIDRLASRHKDSKGREETQATLELRARDGEYGDGALRDFAVLLSVLHRDKEGRPSVIIATKKDVSRELQLRQANSMLSLRYWSVFYNNESGIAFFDSKGTILDANPKACEMFQIDIDQSVKQHVSIGQLLHRSFANLSAADGLRGEKMVGDKHVKYQIKTVCNDLNELLGLFVFCP